MIDGCHSYNMFNDKPDNQPIYYKVQRVDFPMLAVLIHCVFVVVSKLEKKLGAQ
jgi:hypothetical protein